MLLLLFYFYFYFIFLLLFYFILFILTILKTGDAILFLLLYYFFYLFLRGLLLYYWANKLLWRFLKIIKNHRLRSYGFGLILEHMKKSLTFPRFLNPEMSPKEDNARTK